MEAIILVEVSDTTENFICGFLTFEIWNTRVPNLNWSHFRALLRVPDEDARAWYMNEAANEKLECWDLDRKYWHTVLLSAAPFSEKEAVIAEMKEKTAAEPKHQFEPPSKVPSWQNF